MLENPENYSFSRILDDNRIEVATASATIQNAWKACNIPIKNHPGNHHEYFIFEAQSVAVKTICFGDAMHGSVRPGGWR